MLRGTSCTPASGTNFSKIADLPLRKNRLRNSSTRNDLGMSAFVYRLEGTHTFVSKGQVKGQKVQPIHVDISLLKDTSDELDIDKFKAWRKEFADAEFILEEDGKYITGREVEKMSKIQIQCGQSR